MKIRYSRTHTSRPCDYESIMLNGSMEVDTESEEDAEYRDMTFLEIGEQLSAAVDELLDTDVDRVLRLGDQHTDETHLWVFFDKE